MQTTTQQPKKVTEADMIARVRSYVLERKTAYEVQRYSVNNQKLEAIADLLATLDLAKAEADFNPKQAIKTLLSCALNLHYIAPTSTRKIFNTWHSKIEDCLQACREYLNWTKQQNH